ncbi:hypothetical protein V8E54_007224 [Elaphomyces granulatus]
MPQQMPPPKQPEAGWEKDQLKKPDIYGHSLINKIGDPVFALVIGASSAYVRIQREQRERVKQQQEAGEVVIDVGPPSVLETGSRRLRMWWNGEFKGL